MRETDPEDAIESEEAGSSRLRGLFALIAIGFLLTAGLHVLRGLDHDPGDTSSPARHAVFGFVNLCAAVGLYLRPRWIVYPLSLLVVQQLGSHGSLVAQALRAGRAPGWEDLVVTLALPALLALVLWDRAHAPRTDPPVL